MVSGGKAYVANYLGGVLVCDIDAAGELVACVDTGATGLVRPIAVAIKGTWAYIADADTTGGYVMLCTVNPATGAMSSCAQTGPSPIGPYYILIKDDKAYVSDSTGDKVLLCTINNADGTLSCVDSGVTGLNNPRQLATTGSLFWIADQVNDRVLVCSIDAGTGMLGGCQPADSELQPGQPAGLLLGAPTRMYIGQINAEQVSLCDVDPATGMLSNCGDAFSGSVVGYPEGLGGLYL